MLAKAGLQSTSFPSSVLRKTPAMLRSKRERYWYSLARSASSVSRWRRWVNINRTLKRIIEKIKPKRPRKSCLRSRVGYSTNNIRGRISDGRKTRMTREMLGSFKGALVLPGECCQKLPCSAMRQNGIDHARSYHAVSDALEASCARFAIHVETVKMPMIPAIGKYSRRISVDLEERPRASSPAVSRLLRHKRSRSSMGLTN